MATIMTHGPYVAEIEYDEEVGNFHGRTINLSDVLTFHGESAKALQKSFAETVAFYLKTCKDEGVEPAKPYTGKFVLRLSPDVHRAAAIAAASAGKSLNAWIAEKVEHEALQEA